MYIKAGKMPERCSAISAAGWSHSPVSSEALASFALPFEPLLVASEIMLAVLHNVKPLSGGCLILAVAIIGHRGAAVTIFAAFFFARSLVWWIPSQYTLHEGLACYTINGVASIGHLVFHCVATVAAITTLLSIILAEAAACCDAIVAIASAARFSTGIALIISIVFFARASERS